MRRFGFRKIFWAACVLYFVQRGWAAMPLESYLLMPADRPTDCQPANGFYPLNEKFALFYEYRVYRLALPAVLERHAQSFGCGGQEGTLYFFAYASASDAEMAERFARTVLIQNGKGPLLKEFPKGFAIVSFLAPPPILMSALESKWRKTPSNASPPVVVSTVPVAAMPAAIIPLSAAVSVSSAAVHMPSIQLSSAPPESVVAVSTSASVSAVPVSISAPVVGADLSDDVLKALSKALECKSRDLDPEEREACDLVRAFKEGTEPELVIDSGTARMGVAYGIDSNHVPNGRSYVALIGSGRPGEMTLFPVYAATGVEDFEVEEIITSLKQGLPWPTNSVAERIAHHRRPENVTLFPTQGRSYVMRPSPKIQAFIRRAKNQWVVISVIGATAADQVDSEIAIAGLEGPPSPASKSGKKR